MATETIDIVIRERGARVVATAIDNIAVRAASATRSIFLLERALYVVGAGTILKGLINITDTFTNMQNRLRLVTSSSSELAGVTQELFAIANRTRTAFEGTATVYSRTALSLKGLGISQKETLQFTESLNKAIVLSGAGAQEANAALIQLSQGLASNRLSGDELRSVLEQIPFVADVIAKSLGVTRGELRALGKDGELTADVVLKAFREAREEIADKFANTIPTVGQAFTVLKNRAIEVVGTLNQSTGAAQNVANAIILLANNLDSIVNVFSGLAIAIAAVGFSSLIGNLTNAAKATVADTQATIANNAAKLQSIQAITAARNARVADLAAQQAALVADRESLQQSLAINQVQREAAVRVTALQKGMAEATGRTIGYTKALEAQHASTRGLLATQQALRANGAALTAVEAELAVASNAAASAQARLSTAQTAVTFTARAATLATTALNRVLAFFGGPIGLAITAVAIAIGVIATRSTQAEKALDSVDKSVREVGEAFKVAGGNAENLLSKLETLTLSKAITNTEEAAKALSEQFGQLLSQAEVLGKRVTASIFSTASEKDIGFAKQLDELAVKLGDGAISVEDYRKALDEIGTQSETFRPLINDLDELIVEYQSLNTNSEKAQAVLRLLTNSASEADRKLLGLAVSSEDSADSLGKLEAAAKASQKNLDELIKLSPTDSDFAKQTEDTTTAITAYQKAVDELEKDLRKGEITTADFVGEQTRLKGVLDRALDSISGLDKAQKAAADSLADYVLQNRLAGQSDRDRALTQANIEYAKQIDLIKKAGGDQEQLNTAASVYVDTVERINAEFNKIDEDAIRKLGDEETFTKATNALRLQNQEIQNNIAGRTELSAIEQIATTLKRGLTDSEKEVVTSLVRSNEELKVQQKVLNDILGPVSDVKAEIAALDAIYNAGLISLEQYTAASTRLNNELQNLTTTADVVGNSLSALGARIPRLQEQARQVKELSDATKEYESGIKALNEEESKLGITSDTIAARIDLESRFREATKEIDGTADAVRNADKSLKLFTNEGYLDTLDAQSRAVAVQNQEYAELVKTLDKAGASEEQFAAAALANEQQLAAIQARFKEKETKAASRKRKEFTAEDAIADLEREQQALVNVLLYRDEYNKLIAVSARIKGELTPQQEEQILQLERENEVLGRQADLVRELSDEVLDIQNRFSDLNELYDKGLISQQQFNQGIQDNTFAWLEFKESIGEASFADGILLGLEDLAFGVKDFTSEAGRLFGDFTANIAEGFSSAFYQVLTGTKSVRDALYEIANQALASLVQGLIKLGIQYALNAALGQSLAAAATAAQSAQAAALAAAYAPAAAAVSLASYGANAPIAQAGIASTYALTNALSSVGGKVPGFASGGSIDVGGTGGIDSQLVALRASPNERIDVLTPSQQSQRDRQNNQNGASNQTNINNIELTYIASPGEDSDTATRSLLKELTEKMNEIQRRDGR